MNFSRLLWRYQSVCLLLAAFHLLAYLLMAARTDHWLYLDTGDMIEWGANVAALTLSGDAWRLLASIFINVGVGYLVLNLYTLLVLGPVLERLYGHVHFTLIYLLSGLFGNLVSALYFVDGTLQTQGSAPGPMMGLCGACLGQWLATPAHRGAPLPAGLRTPLVQSLIINVMLLGFGGLYVDHANQLGGLISGVMLGAAFALTTRAHGTRNKVAASTAIAVSCLICIGLVVSRAPTEHTIEDGDQLRYAIRKGHEIEAKRDEH